MKVVESSYGYAAMQLEAWNSLAANLQRMLGEETATNQNEGKPRRQQNQARQRHAASRYVSVCKQEPKEIKWGESGAAYVCESTGER